MPTVVLPLAAALAAALHAANVARPAAAFDSLRHSPLDSVRDSRRDSTRGASDGRRAITAVRASAPVVVDGRLGDAAWATAALASEFLQRAPSEGRPATERTEVRLLYDDDALYVAARLYDAHPDSILALLARRDESTPSDEFFVGIDSYHDRRTAFMFSVTPRGVKSDQIIYDENTTDPSWDAVWDAATHIDSLGWTAELRIPLTQLRFSSGARGGGERAQPGELVWGINFFRWIGRRSEDAQWSLIPRDSPAWVSHYGELRGIRLGRSPRRLEVVPYSLTRVTRAPGERANPLYASTDFLGTAGADVKYGVTSNLTLTGTVNPDFGQVEADPSEVNLTTVETFLPEKRAFFVEGTNIFRMQVGEGFTDEDLFYSRRIGRAPQGAVPDTARYDDSPTTTRILGAAKLSGKTGGGLSLGLLDVVTREERADFVDSNGTRERTPLEPRTNYAVARVLKDYRNGASTVGAIVTSTDRALPSGGALSFLPRSAQAGGIDTRHRVGRDNAYQLSAWLLGSSVRGDAEALDSVQRSPIHYFQRPDAPRLNYRTDRTSLAGWAASVRASKIAGAWRWGLRNTAYSPGFHFNDLGFQRTSDQVRHFGWFGHEHFRPGRRVRSWLAYTNAELGHTFGGERVASWVNVFTSAQFQNNWSYEGELRRDFAELSPSALRGGPALRTSGLSYFWLRGVTDRRRALSWEMSAEGRRADERESSHLTLRPGVTLRPSTAAQLSLLPSVTWTRNDAQYVAQEDALGSRRYVLGALRQTTASATARFNYTFTPDFTLQLYAQPFLSAGAYSRFKTVEAPRARRAAARFRELAPGQLTHDTDADEYGVDLDGDRRPDFRFDDPDFNTKSLRSTAVLRWEYRPGSSLFAVWGHDRSADDSFGSFDFGRDSRRLFDLEATNIFLVKVSYWLSL